MKKLFTVLAILAVMLMTSACQKQKAGILFNKYPITEETILNNEYVFKPNTRIYYLVVLPQKIHSRYAYLQIIKKGSNGIFGYNIYHGRDIRLKNEQIHVMILTRDILNPCSR